MRFSPLLLSLFAGIAGLTPAQVTTNVDVGTVRLVGSYHTTTYDGYQSWGGLSLQSPGGQWYSDDTYNGSDYPDGSVDVPVTLNEIGLWQVWRSYGYGAPQSSSSWAQLEEYLNVRPAGPMNSPPTITWTSAPISAGVNIAYTVTAHGHDANGNLTQVNVWKNGQPFAFAGGGNGTDQTSGNTTSDGAAQTVTFTAQAVDGSGATSALITHPVTITAPINQAPAITWIAAPGIAGYNQAYTVTALGTDPDGNLAQVNVWKNGAPFAFAGGGDGSSGTSGNTTADAGPQTITFTAQAVDGGGAISSTISHVVTIGRPPNQPPAVTLEAPAGQTVPVGTPLILRSRATDPDGNLTGHNLDIQRPAGDWNFQGGFATGEPFQGGPVGSAADSTRVVNFTFSDVGTYTIRAAADDGSGWVHSGTVTVTVLPPPPVNRAPTITWLANPDSVAHLESYRVSVRGEDADGNLSQVNVWKNGAPFAFAGGGTGTTGDSGNASADNGPQTITYTAQAVDTDGRVSPLITHTVTVAAPPLVYYNLTTAAGAGGTVSPGGSYLEGTQVVLNAIPDSIHDFTGWTGDASAATPSVSVVMDRDKSVQATFGLKTYALTTTASTGGTVTPGGTYAHGTTITLSATAASNYRFIGWAADASGSAPSVAVVMDRPKTVQGVFVAKTAQTITFPPLTDQNLGSSPLSLHATASSGLPVSYVVLSGPATVTDDELLITGPGPIMVAAHQTGNGVFMPAPSVSQSFRAVAAATLKYHSPARTLLQDETRGTRVPFILETP